MGIPLTAQQRSALSKTTAWYRKGNDQVFTISGYAGTGKSTLVYTAVKELNLKSSSVAFATLTGKAALVLTIKGNPACTLHSLIYDYQEDNATKELIFVKKESLPPGLKILVVDEISMVPKDILEDLKSYGIRILALGDEGQLPPIGESNGLLDNPDVFLSEIHRQAADNPIIHLSMLAREGKKIPYGKYGKTAAVISKSRASIDLLLKADQVLCGLNATRQQLNQAMRDKLGFRGPLPQQGDKIICTRNKWGQKINVAGIVEGKDIPINLVNGMVGYRVDDGSTVQEKERLFTMSFQPEFVSPEYLFVDLPCDFQDFRTFPEKIYRKEEKKVCHFDFGNAITVHKSQGSQWDNVIVWDEKMRDHGRWLYTAVTRAAERLIYVA
ncbi:MAG: ATP-dependent DNA helicase [Bacillota bacterium]